MEERKAEGSELVDSVLDAAVGQIPEDSTAKQVATELGWVGLAIGVVLGNIPVTVLISAWASGKASISSDVLAVYFDVFVLVAPWVAVFAVLSLWLHFDTPAVGGPQALFILALAVLGGGWASYELGGALPADVAAGPQSGSPGGSAVYVVDSLGAYLELYGPIPPIAGAIQGLLYGRWASLLMRD